jgi:hypothetical protein
MRLPRPELDDAFADDKRMAHFAARLFLNSVIFYKEELWGLDTGDFFYCISWVHGDEFLGLGRSGCFYTPDFSIVGATPFLLDSNFLTFETNDENIQTLLSVHPQNVGIWELLN